METTRVQKTADQLKVGDWIAPAAFLDDASEVLNVLAWPETDPSHVHLTVREPSNQEPHSESVFVKREFPIMSGAELDAMRVAAERGKKIAEIRAFADWLEANDWAPMPASLHGQTYGLTVEDVRRFAEKAGKDVDETYDDRTDVDLDFGFISFTVIAWHRGGRPAEPEPSPRVAKGLGALVDHVSGALAGLDYSRADEVQDPQPVTGRVPSRAGDMVGPLNGGRLVDIDPDSSMEAHSDAEVDRPRACESR